MVIAVESPTPTRRARSPKDKEQKRDKILKTAAELFNLDSDALPTAAAIAQTTGIAKGTVYLYFKSKEEIFLALLEQHYSNWYSDISSAIDVENPDGETVINAICHYIEAEPEFFRLASLSSSIIEQNVDVNILMAYKNRMAQRVQETAKTLAMKLNEEDHSTCSQLLVRSYAMLLGLWQLSNPPEKIAPILKSTSSLKSIQPDFQLESRQALAQLWQGYLEQADNKGKSFWKLGGLFGSK